LYALIWLNYDEKTEKILLIFDKNLKFVCWQKLKPFFSPKKFSFLDAESVFKKKNTVHTNIFPNKNICVLNTSKQAQLQVRPSQMHSPRTWAHIWLGSISGRMARMQDHPADATGSAPFLYFFRRPCRPAFHWIDFGLAGMSWLHVLAVLAVLATDPDSSPTEWLSACCHHCLVHRHFAF